MPTFMGKPRGLVEASPTVKHGGRGIGGRSLTQGMAGELHEIKPDQSDQAHRMQEPGADEGQDQDRKRA